MKNILKILSALFISICFLFASSFYDFLPLNIFSASAAVNIYNDMLLYSVEQDEVSITGSFDGNYDDIVIPSEIDGLPVVRIASSAFSSCHYVKTVIVPESVNEIESGAFANCKGLININVSEDNPAYSSFEGMLYDKHGNCLLRCPCAKQGSEIVFPETISSIADTGFESCVNINEINIPDTVTYIGERAFYECTSLKTIIMPSSLEVIESASFMLCRSLVNITFPEQLKIIKKSAFSHCSSLTEVNIPNEVEKIADRTFSYCTSLKSVTLPETLTYIEPYCFYTCQSLENVAMPNSIEEIRVFAFNNCTSLKKIELSANLKILGDYSFAECTSLENINIPEGLTDIRSSAFANCKSIREMNIGSKVSSIKSDAFVSCTSLQNIVISPENEEYADLDGILMNKSMNEIICYPSAKQNQYFTVPDSVTSIAGSAFSGCIGIEYINIPDSVTTIAENAFENSSICSVNIGRGLIVISYSMFMNCKDLQSITINENINQIRRKAFQGCTNLTSVVLLNGVQKIEENAFLDCAFSEINIPESVTEIGKNALGYKLDENGKSVPMEDFTISGLQDGAAEKYAFSYGFKFDPIYIQTSVSDTGPSVTTTTTASAATTITTTATTTNTYFTITEQIPGDVNGDKKVDMSDASAVLKYYSGSIAGLSPKFSEMIPGRDENAAFLAADINGDDVIDLSDVSLILYYYAKKIISIYQ